MSQRQCDRQFNMLVQQQVNQLTVARILKLAQKSLQRIADQPRLEAEILLAHIIKQPRSMLHAWPDAVMTEGQCQDFFALLTRRVRGEPIAYLIGEREFWSRPFFVTTDTLIPRPETEYLVQTILDLPINHNELKTVAELGTGSGAVILSVAKERPGWSYLATDISDAALAVAKQNAKRHNVTAMRFHQGDWCSALGCETFDLIISNPPYIGEHEWHDYAKGLTYEPKLALLSGFDGLTAIRQIINSAKHYLNINGCLLIEHGFLQAEEVRAIFSKAGFQNVRTVCDLENRDRISLGWWY